MKTKLHIVGEIILFLEVALAIILIFLSVGKTGFSPLVAFEIGIDIFGMLVGAILFLACNIRYNRNPKDNFLFLTLIFLTTTNIANNLLFHYLNGNIALIGLSKMINAYTAITGVLIGVVFYFYFHLSFNINNKRTKVLNQFVMVLADLFIIMFVFNYFFGFLFYIDNKGYYQRTEQFYIGYSFGILLVVFIICFGIINKISMKKILSLYAYVLLPLSVIIFQLFIVDISIVFSAAMVSLLLAYSKIYIEQGRKIEENEIVIAKEKADNIMNQIEPHFIYNVLTSIYYLVDHDKEKAKNAISNFSTYLRSNISAYDKQRIIPFEDELNCCNNYLTLEKIRFEDELNIVYDIKVKSFSVPCFSVQSLVENAVKHGISQKKNGGTLLIKTEEDEDSYKVIIQDDGVGFDVDAIKDGTHVGIKNTRYRLDYLLKGSLLIESEIDKGTTSTIIIPKESVK